jgi:hypothetical protein
LIDHYLIQYFETRFSQASRKLLRVLAGPFNERA